MNDLSLVILEEKLDPDLTVDNKNPETIVKKNQIQIQPSNNKPELFFFFFISKVNRILSYNFGLKCILSLNGCEYDFFYNITFMWIQICPKLPDRKETSESIKSNLIYLTFTAIWEKFLIT